jgi:hypothetical protein
MTKEEFILFINELGFIQTWTSKPDVFSMATDVVGNPNQNAMAFADQLNIHLDDEHGLAHLSLSQMSTHMMTGKNFGSFSLETFGNKNDIQIEIFLSFILGSFNKKPIHIIQYMRDKKISDILK